MKRNVPDSRARADFGIEELGWDPAKPEQSLENAYKSETDFARNKISWYFEVAEQHKSRTKWIRNLVLALFVAGSLCPLIDATGFVPGWRLPSWGYVCIAVAAGMFFWDRILGASSGWRRDTLTWISIRQALTAFHYDWVLSREGEIPARVEKLKSFRH